MTVVAVIPARFGSSRFPGKPLALIGGRPMVTRVAEQVLRTSIIDLVVVATDDERIAQAVASLPVRVAMTGPCASGTDRCHEALRVLGVETHVVLNVQGDEPLVEPRLLSALVSRVQRGDIDVATPFKWIDRRTIHGPRNVSVAATVDERALYFSRSPIPHGADPLRQHVGLYAYTYSAISRFCSVAPTVLELAEGLEQLRALEIGLRIGLVETEYEPIAVDIPEDIALVEAALRREPTRTAVASRLSAVVLDVDGVLTDGTIAYAGPDLQIMGFSVRDGLALQELLRRGCRVIVVSGRSGASLDRRMRELNVREYHTGVEDKAALLRSLIAQGLEPLNTGYVGDDLNDVGAMALVGLRFAPSDACRELQDDPSVVLLPAAGGRGVVRALLDVLAERLIAIGPPDSGSST